MKASSWELHSSTACKTSIGLSAVMSSFAETFFLKYADFSKRNLKFLNWVFTKRCKIKFETEILFLQLSKYTLPVSKKAWNCFGQNWTSYSQRFTIIYKQEATKAFLLGPYGKLERYCKPNRVTAWVRDGTGQDFLDPTRPVNFKIYAGWPAGQPVSLRAGRPVFLRKVFVHGSMHVIKNFQKGGIGEVLKFAIRTGVSKNFSFFAVFFCVFFKNDSILRPF